MKERHVIFKRSLTKPISSISRVQRTHGRDRYRDQHTMQRHRLPARRPGHPHPVVQGRVRQPHLQRGHEAGERGDAEEERQQAAAGQGDLQHQPDARQPQHKARQGDRRGRVQVQGGLQEVQDDELCDESYYHW